MFHVAHGRIGALVAALGLCVALGASAAVAVGVSGGYSRRPSPATGLLPNGRQLAPAGTRVTLGNLPTGAALTADGRFLFTVSAGIGNNDVRIVDTARHRVCQTLPVPGASGGIALDSVHKLAYVSGLQASLWLPTQFPLPGARGNVVQVINWSGSCGQARVLPPIAVAPQKGAPAPQVFPPNPKGTPLSWPEKLAVSADGSRLLVALNLAASAAVIDLNHGDQVHYVALGSGSYPFGAAITPDGRTGLVTNEATGTMSVIDMQSAKRIAGIRVGAALSHPEGVVVDSSRTRAYVALSNADQVAVVNLNTRRVVRTISVGSSFGLRDDAGCSRAGSIRRAVVRGRVWCRCGGGDPSAGQGNAGNAGLHARRSCPDGRAARSGAHQFHGRRAAGTVDLDRRPGRRHRANSRGPQPRGSQRPDLLGVSPDPPAQGRHLRPGNPVRRDHAPR